MSENKTKPTGESVAEFINSIADDQRREDSKVILKMMQEVTGLEPAIWYGMVGFGLYHYKYESGREGDMFQIGFSPRKQQMTLYVMTEQVHNSSLLSSLGKHTTSKACLYIKKLADVDLSVLRDVIQEAWDTAPGRNGNEHTAW